jgi:hypothetical protein
MIYMILSRVSKNPYSFLARYHWISWLRDSTSGEMLDSRQGYAITRRAAERRARRQRQNISDAFSMPEYFAFHS